MTKAELQQRLIETAKREKHLTATIQTLRHDLEANLIHAMQHEDVREASTESLKLVGHWIAEELVKRERASQPNPKNTEAMPESTPLTDAQLRASMLDKAKEYVCNDRNSTYGTPEQSFQAISLLWSTYLQNILNANSIKLSIRLSPTDVSLLLSLMKVARLQANPAHEDSWIDMAGYAACGFGIIMEDKQRAEQQQLVNSNKAKQHQPV